MQYTRANRYNYLMLSVKHVDSPSVLVAVVRVRCSGSPTVTCNEDCQGKIMYEVTARHKTCRRLVRAVCLPALRWEVDCQWQISEARASHCPTRSPPCGPGQLGMNPCQLERSLLLMVGG